jgi:hypothetical protein
MMVEIVCPNCGFSKRVPREKIPLRVKWATCPSCRSRFQITGEGFGSPLHDQNGQVDWVHDVPPSPLSDQETRPQGFWKGLYQAAKAALFYPGRFFRDMLSGRGIREALAFGLLFGSVGAMFGWFWQFLMLFEKFRLIAEYFMGQVTLGILFVGILVLVPLFVVLEILFSTCILHVTLLIVRGAGHGFDATFKVMAYSQASQILGLIPFVGGLIGWFWQLVIRIIGLKEIHQTTYLRVIMAFLLPIVAMILVAVTVTVTVLLLS